MSGTPEQDLFGTLTFDQQCKIAGQDITNRDIAPNRRIAAEIVFEPLDLGIRVTARDADHRVLWGYIGTRETVRQVHCEVAVYDTLQELLAGELRNRGLLESGDAKDPIAAASAAIDELEKTAKRLRDSIDVKTITEATKERARMIARIVADGNRQISLEAGMLKGMKAKGEPADDSEVGSRS